MSDGATLADLQETLRLMEEAVPRKEQPDSVRLTYRTLVHIVEKVPISIEFIGAQAFMGLRVEVVEDLPHGTIRVFNPDGEQIDELHLPIPPE